MPIQKQFNEKLNIYEVPSFLAGYVLQQVWTKSSLRTALLRALEAARQYLAKVNAEACAKEALRRAR